MERLDFLTCFLPSMGFGLVSSLNAGTVSCVALSCTCAYPHF